MTTVLLFHPPLIINKSVLFRYKKCASPCKKVHAGARSVKRRRLQ